jgi:hypothetical protein
MKIVVIHGYKTSIYLALHGRDKGSWLFFLIRVETASERSLSANSLSRSVALFFSIASPSNRLLHSTDSSIYPEWNGQEGNEFANSSLFYSAQTRRPQRVFQLNCPVPSMANFPFRYRLMPFFPPPTVHFIQNRMEKTMMKVAYGSNFYSARKRHP